MVEIKRIISFIFYPLKTINYFNDYFHLIEQKWRHHDGETITLLKVVNAVLALKVLHYFYLSFWSSGTWHENVLNFDAFYLTIGKHQMNLAACASIVMLIYYNWLLFGWANYPLLKLMRQIMIENNWRVFFLGSHFQGRNVCGTTQRYFLVMLNLFISVLGSSEIVTFVGYLYFIYVMAKHWQHFIANEPTFSEILYLTHCIALNHLNCAGFGLAMLLLCHALAVNNSATNTLLVMFYIRMKQVFQILTAFTSRPGKPFPYFGYNQFWLKYIQTLSFFFSINRLYGRLFCAFLVTYVPINLAYTMWIIQKAVSPGSIMLLYSWISYIGNLLFVFHYIFSQCTKLIHKPAKMLLHFIVQLEGPVHIRTRIRLAIAVAALHATNRYGFTYGDFGLVSLQTFGKFILLYGKFCLISYKLMKKNIL